MFDGKENKLLLDDTQVDAVDRCCDLKIRIVPVTGAAGTGKTTILQNVFRRLHKQEHSVVLCAPTGKAAKRITEATGIPAQTIHRLLEYPHPGEVDPKTGKTLLTSDPKKDRRNPIAAKVILVDEYAMVSVEVHRNLLDAMPPGGVIRMFGDANQLQPIETNKRLQAEPSSFLKMIEKFDGIRLETIHRQANDSAIITNGQRIIKGECPLRKDDFKLVFSQSPVDAVISFIMDNLAIDIDFGGTTNQIISPTKKGWIGTEALNASITAERQKWSTIEEQRFYVGDKVIFTVNNYGLDVFNGETGIITLFNADGSITVNFGDKDITIPVAQEMEGRNGTYYFSVKQKKLLYSYYSRTVACNSYYRSRCIRHEP